MAERATQTRAVRTVYVQKLVISVCRNGVPKKNENITRMVWTIVTYIECVRMCDDLWGGAVLDLLYASTKYSAHY